MLASASGSWQHLGRLEEIERGSAWVLAAPHGTYDRFTDEIAVAVAEQLGWSALIGRGFNNDGRRINVNRPTEGMLRRNGAEHASPAAQEVFAAYQAALARLHPAPALYVELHGQQDRAQLNQIEVTSKGFSLAELQRLRQILREEWARVSDDQEVVVVDGIDRVHMTGTAVKRIGVMKDLERALMFELPAQRRRHKREELAQFLIAALPRLTAELLPPPTGNAGDAPPGDAPSHDGGPAPAVAVDAAPIAAPAGAEDGGSGTEDS